MSQRDDEIARALRDGLRAQAPVGAPADLFSRIRADVSRTPQGHRWLTVWRGRLTPRSAVRAASAAVTVVVALLAVGIAIQLPTAGPATQPPTATVVTTASPIRSDPPTLAPITPYPAAALIPGATNFPVLAAGSVWAPRIGRGDVVRFDPGKNEIIARVAVSDPLAERGPHAIAARGDEIWVNADDPQGWAVIRIDPTTNQVVERIAVGVPGWAMAIVEDTMWMTSWERGRVLRIDLAAGEVVTEIVLPDPLGVAAREDGVWVALGGRGTVARIDPATNEHRLIEIGTETTTIPTIVADEVWVTTLYSQEIVIISAESDAIIDRIQTQGPMGAVERDGLVWVSDSFMEEGGRRSEPRVIALDVATRGIVHELPMPGLELDRGIAVDESSVWVVTTDGIARLDLDS